MAIDRNKLVRMYYIEERKMLEIADKVGLKSSNAVAYNLFERDPKFLKRDREWTSSDDFELATKFSKLAHGKDFNKDAESLAIELQFRLSVIIEKMRPLWESKFQRTVNAKLIENVLGEKVSLVERVEELPNTSEVNAMTLNGETITLKVFKMFPDAILPKYATAGSVGLDLYAYSPTTLTKNGGQAVVRTGIVIKIPDGYAGLVLPRSGLAMNYGVTVLNGPGLIDQDYCGATQGEEDEIKVLLINHSSGASGHALDIKHGDRVAQLLLVPVPKVIIEEVTAEDMTKDSRGGFGSTGK